MSCTCVLCGGLVTLLAFGCVSAPSRPETIDAELGEPSSSSAAAVNHALTASTGDSALSIALNLPAFRLDVLHAGVLVRSYPVAVGMPKYSTPLGAFAVSQIEWNPWWIPPAREWARNEKVTPPGPHNPMGKVKMYFRSLYFLHGTPVVASIGSAASHGCVRMRNEDAVALARLLHAHGAPAGSAAVLDSVLVDWTPTRVIVLSRPIPLAIRYDLAEVRHDSLYLYPDMYRLAGAAHASSARSALARAGVDTAFVRAAALARAARQARRAAVAIPLDSVVVR